MQNEKLIDSIIWVVIIIMGLISAYVCFGVLNSQASGPFKQYSVGGAIVGAIISWSILTSIYLQVRKSSNELVNLKKRADELEKKLLRGAPRPKDFETEVAERQRIVLARPKEWKPKGGIIFDLELLADDSRIDGDTPTKFQCSFVPIEKSLIKSKAKKSISMSKDKYYENELKIVKEASQGSNPYISSYNSEFVQIGGEQSGVESLKFIFRQFYRSEIKASPDSGKIEKPWYLISRYEFVGLITDIEPSSLKTGKNAKVRLKGYYFREGIVCLVHGEIRETQLIKHGGYKSEAVVTLLDKDVEFSRLLELTLENPDTGGLQSNSVTVPVIDYKSNVVNDENSPLESKSDNTQDNNKIDTALNSENLSKESIKPDEDKKIEPKEIYQQVIRMRIICYHEQLETVYFFDFWDDVNDFVKSSTLFNQVTSSVRFLD